MGVLEGEAEGGATLDANARGVLARGRANIRNGRVLAMLLCCGEAKSLPQVHQRVEEYRDKVNDKVRLSNTFNELFWQNFICISFSAD